MAWSANAFDICCGLDNNAYTEGVVPSEFETLLAVGSQAEIQLIDDIHAFEKLKTFQKTHQDWLFGFLSYDLKNSVENLESHNLDCIQMPDLHFFSPVILIKINLDSVEILKNEHPEWSNEDIFHQIDNYSFNSLDTFHIPNSVIKARFSKEEYIQTIQAIKAHILRGDIYEMNFCQEFFIDNILIDPISLFLKLNAIAQAPFAAFYKLRTRFLLCGSPERFLKKQKQKLISQPIKGTSKRGKTELEDDVLKTELYNDPKNRSENVMIVDLVRNDLGKTCEIGTVKVKELFGIYTFPTVHQMISTIEGSLRKDCHAIDAIRHSFPMGSMTGAPKVRAMQLIEQYEKTKRGLYSGAVGYITPDGDFDFNVVIRSILYNKINRYLSFQVGGAIVADSEPDKEYEECLIKTQSIKRALGIEIE